MRPVAGNSRLGGLAFLLAIAGCGQDSAAPPAASPPEPELPAIGAVGPSEAFRIDEEKYLEIPSPPDLKPLRWDFSPGRHYRYQVSQRLSQVTAAASGGARGVTRSQDKGAGYFEFIAKGDGTAAARVKIQTRESMIDGRPAPPEAIERRPPTQFEHRIDEEGVPSAGRQAAGASDPRIFLDAFLALQEGERKTVDGTIRTRIAGCFKVERYECARLEGEFELAPDLPSGKTLLRGRSVAYFAIRERRFVRAEMSIAQAIRTKGRTEKGAWVTRATDLETEIRLRLME
jgi:hypothetical protein